MARSPTSGMSREGSLALRSAYLELFMLAGHLLEGRVGAPQVQTVRSRAELLLKDARQRLLSAGVSESWVEAVQLPVVGLVDEAARKNPSAGAVGQWRSLQFPLYGHEEVGHKTFERLNELRRDPDTPIEVLELFLVALLYGFQGQYAPTKLDDLEILSESLKNELQRKQGRLPPLSPHLEADIAAIDPPRLLSIRWIVAMAVIVMCAVGITLTLSIHLQARSAVRSLIDAEATMTSGSRSPAEKASAGGP